jgi:hypothetical protein
MNGSDFFRKLHSFFSSSSQEKFEEVFGTGMGAHLFNKWTGVFFSDVKSYLNGFDLLNFIGNLDSTNLELLYSFLTKGE